MLGQVDILTDELVLALTSIFSLSNVTDCRTATQTCVITFDAQVYEQRLRLHRG